MLVRRVVSSTSFPKLFGCSYSSFSKIGSFASYTSSPASSLSPKHEEYSYRSENELAEINWDELRFGLVPTDCMYVMKSSQDGEFTHGELRNFDNIKLNPSSGVLNYGQGLYEGLKASRKRKGGLLLFRVEENAMRMKMGADRMFMPSPSVDQFINAVKLTVLANKRWVPPHGKGSLYVRPLLIGNGPILGLAPSPEYMFLVYASPVGNYFKVLKAQMQAKSKGFSDVLFLDAVNNKYLEEASSCNIFIVKGNVISTPETNGTILPGITRKSIIEIASDLGYQVEERQVSVEELSHADEVFCTGTAVVVAPVASISYNDKRYTFKTGKETVSKRLYNTLTAIQMGLVQDNKGWTSEI